MYPIPGRCGSARSVSRTHALRRFRLSGRFALAVADRDAERHLRSRDSRRTACAAGNRRLARRRRSGLWSGLAAIRELRGRGRLIALVVLGIVAQIARNWLVLHAVGVHTSILNAIAVLIVSVSLSPLPVGAGVGATATILILGSHGLADTAAAGVLLTVTGTVAAFCYAAWACGDHALVAVRARRAAALAAPLGAA